MASFPELRLKPEREKSLLRRHPWVFSGAVAEVRPAGAAQGASRIGNDPSGGGALQAGEVVKVLSAKGDFLGWGGYSPKSQYQARIWSWDANERIDADFFRRRLAHSIAQRANILSDGHTNACRLVHAESDGLPGLVVDRYADWLVVQVLSAGAEPWRETLADLLVELTGITNIYERSDVDVRRLEGLPPRSGLLRGNEPPGPVEILENGQRFLVDLRSGHKTGHYLDQRENRRLVGELAGGRDVLDCFAYTGGFSVYANAGGARSVVTLDSSADALSLARQNLLLNGVTKDKIQLREDNVFQALRKFRDQGQKFDLIVLDPPKFAQTAAQAQRAASGYKDINLLAFKLLRPGGLLATFSCSGGVSDDLFQKIIAGAALDAGVDAQVLAWMHQGPDHPVALNFPEGAYLKGLVCRI